MSDWRSRWLSRLDETGRYPTWVLVAVLAGMFSTSFPFTILAVSLGPIAEELGSTETTIAWVVTAPMLLSAVAFPVLGKLGDLRGHRKIFLAGFFGATVVAVLTALAWDAYSLIGFRILAGVLGSATQPTAMALLFTVYQGGARSRAMGWWAMTTSAAPALGLILGGPLVDLLGWRVVFVVQAVLGFGALLLAWAVLRETRTQSVSFDIPGAVSLLVGVGGFMAMLALVRELGVESPWVSISAATGVLGLVLFLQIEKRAAHPLLPLALFRMRSFNAILITNALISAAYMGAFILSPLLLYELFDFSVTAAALLMAFRTASLSIAAPIGGILGDYLGERTVAIAGAVLMTLALAAMSWSAYHLNLVVFCIALIAQGVSDGISNPAVNTAISHTVDESNLGVASATNRMLGQMGASFGIAAITLVYAGVGTAEVFGGAFALAAGVAGAAIVSALNMQRREQAPQQLH